MKSREERKKKTDKDFSFEKCAELVQVKVNEAYLLPQGWAFSVIGSFKRKAKGQEYVSPRLLLNHYFKKHIGKRCMILEGKASIEGRPRYQNQDVLICFVFEKKE